MATTSSFLPLVLCETSLAIIITGSIIALGTHWRESISNYIDPLGKTLIEGNYPPLARTELVTYSQVHPALFDPVYAESGVITGASPEIAALRAYMSVVEIIKDHQKRHPKSSIFLWHIAAGQHGSGSLDSDPNWKIVCGELKRRNVNISMVLLNDCPIFVQLFAEISPLSSCITPWFPTFPGHQFLLSGFMPPGDLGGAVPSPVSAAHPAPPIPVPSIVGVTSWNPPSELRAHGTQYSDDQRVAQPFTQHPGPDFYPAVLPIDPFLNAYGGSLASTGSSAADTVESQTYLNLNNISVPEAQGLDPMDWFAPPHSGRVEGQQLTFQNYTNSPDDSSFASPNSDPIQRTMSPGSSDETVTNNDEWTGKLILNGTGVHVRTVMAEGIRDPNLSDLPNELGIELALGSNLSPLDIQAWISENQASVVRLVSCVDASGTDNCDFGWLVQKIRDKNYATVTLENRYRLLLAALGESLLCAEFPEKGTAKLPTPQPLPPVRKQNRQKKESPQKKEGSQKKERKNSRQGSLPYPARSPKSSNGPREGRYLAAAAQSTTTVQLPQSEQPPQMTYDPAMESTRGEINSPSQHQQMGGFPLQMGSPPQFQVEQHPYPQAPLGVSSAHGEQPASFASARPPTNCVADPFNLNSDALEDPKMYADWIDFDGCGD